MFISTTVKRLFFFSSFLTALAVGSIASAGEPHLSTIHDEMFKAFNEGTDELRTLMKSTELTAAQRRWINRQHRTAKIRVEILLEKGICPADIELIRQDIRGLVDAVESIRRNQVFAQSTQPAVHP